MNNVKGEVRLFDSQWVAVVNHDHGYKGWVLEDAVAHAVRMTEQFIAENVASGQLPPQSSGGGMPRYDLRHYRPTHEGDDSYWKAAGVLL